MEQNQERCGPVRLQLKDGTLTALLTGEIDHHTAREMREAIDDTAVRVRPARLVMDFSGVQFMDSSGVGLIMGRCKLFASWKGRVIVQNIPPKLERIVSLAGLNTLCDVVKEAKIYESDE